MRIKLDLKFMVRKLDTTRAAIGRLAEEQRQLLGELSKNETYRRLQEVLEEKRRLTKSERGQYALIKSLALENYDGNKHPHPRVTITRGKSPIPVYDEEEMVRWAVEHGRLDILRVDKSDADNIARALQPDFVTLKENLSIRIARE